MCFLLLLATCQISEGSYNLNDLHKAAGGSIKHRSNQRIRNLPTIKTLNERISSIEPVDSKAGRYGGTFVCKELVYDYAMWINPSS